MFNYFHFYDPYLSPWSPKYLHSLVCRFCFILNLFQLPLVQALQTFQPLPSMYKLHLHPWLLLLLLPQRSVQTHLSSQELFKIQVISIPGMKFKLEFGWMRILLPSTRVFSKVEETSWNLQFFHPHYIVHLLLTLIVQFICIYTVYTHAFMPIILSLLSISLFFPLPLPLSLSLSLSFSLSHSLSLILSLSRSENNINGEILLELNYELLKDMKLASVGERARILQSIKKLRVAWLKYRRLKVSLNFLNFWNPSPNPLNLLSRFKYPFFFIPFNFDENLDSFVKHTSDVCLLSILSYRPLKPFHSPHIQQW